MRALVTGLGNVGSATAKLLLANGWEVVGVARTIDPALLDTSMFRAISVDLADPDAISLSMLRRTLFDLVVMTHGTQHGVEIGDPTFESWYKEIVDNNLTSAVHLTNHLIFNKLLNPGALIIYCSSIHAMQPRAARGPYAIAKAGLEALARVVAIEQADKGIRALALRLGQCSQPMKGIVFTPEQEAAIKDKTPLQWVEPAEIAALCLALYEQKSLSGAVLSIDSGHSLNIWAGL